MSKGKKILVIEKEEEARELMVMRLESRHHKVIQASSTPLAMRALEREVLDLILLSTDMEPVDGKPLLQVIRSRSHLMAVPIILLAKESNLTELMLGHEKGYDDFIIKPVNPLVLQIRVNLSISKTQERVEANALTHLPGNHAIEKIVSKKIRAGEKFSVLYIDVNHFKSFNDRYGFQKGDDVILQTARLLVATSSAVSFAGECFVGHLGGDDFIVVTPPELEDVFARQFLDDFDSVMPTYYSKEDREAGCIRVENRRGEMENFPLMSCSVAACTNLYKNYSSLREISQDAVEVKSFLKTQPGSHYLQDRRFMPIQKIDEAVHILAPEIKASARRHKKSRVDPLGQVLLSAGLINESQLSEALKKHFETGQRLGQTLIGMNLVPSHEVGKMLEQKLKLPYFRLKDWSPSPELRELFTGDLIARHRVMPVEVTEGAVKLAMCDPFDIRTLDMIERITGLKPIPCLALEDEFEVFLEKNFPSQPVDIN
ncbi:MAG: Response regulator PleD [Candidatus Omnitrophica bacterium ADurb.Bin292]|jgi:diguanylate cyclase (GGDEF)-like protein|nr:MAG: Response regulator PleD [Candidatus Omnitrophica bacterium ADurb.Bin292]